MSRPNEGRKTAKEFGKRFGERSFVEVSDMLADHGKDSVVESFPAEFQEGQISPVDALEQYWLGLYGQFGTFEELDVVEVEDGEATVEFVFEGGSETGTIVIGESGISDLRFSPAYEPPAYVDQHAFSEREVEIDCDDVSLDGILTVPCVDGPVPGAVLVHGAGIHDSDGTVGASKILKDLAWGLASEGIAALRYEKRLRDHEVSHEEQTVDRIVVDDAVVAVETMAGIDEVAVDEIFVVGHSQGGMCAPRIARRCKDVGGIVILDGPANTTIDPDELSTLRYTIEPDGDLSEEQESQLASTKEEFRRIANGEYADDEFLAGRPGAWHRSAQDCDPAGTASDLDVPTFVLKTGRADEEVQPELCEYLRGEFEVWESVDLSSGSRVEFYEDVDHYFQHGPTPSTMDALYFGGNVAEYVISDVTDWISAVLGGEPVQT